MKTVLRLSLVCVLCMFVGCNKQPQQVRHLHEKQEPDSAMMEQLRFNLHMADAADKLCQQAVDSDTLTYALDEFGFWYAKMLRTSGDTIKTGQSLTLHMIISELNGPTIADVEDVFTVGTGDLPISINRSLTMMSIGEQMSIIAPWYAAYGVEGTKLVKPYTNLRIIINAKQ